MGAPVIAALLLVAAIQFPVPEPVSDSRSALKAVLLAHAVAQAADVITTRGALDRGGVEANPAMRPFAGSTWKLALVKAVMTAGVSAALWWVGKKHPRVALVIGGLAAVGTGYIAYRNAGVGR